MGLSQVLSRIAYIHTNLIYLRTHKWCRGIKKKKNDFFKKKFPPFLLQQAAHIIKLWLAFFFSLLLRRTYLWANQTCLKNCAMLQLSIPIMTISIIPSIKNDRCQDGMMEWDSLHWESSDDQEHIRYVQFLTYNMT